MSFGFSVGDFIAGVELVTQLVEAFSKTTGASAEYQRLCSDLNVCHRTLQQLQSMQEKNIFSQGALNEMKYIADAGRADMDHFLKKNEKYQESLRVGGSGSAMKDGINKIGWSFAKPKHVEQLRSSLQLKMITLNVLVSAAIFYQSQDQKSNAFNSLSVQPRILQLNPKEVVVGTGPDWNREDREDITWDDRPGVLTQVFRAVSLRTSDEEQDSSFIQQQDAASFYRTGQVFMVQWCIELSFGEPEGGTSNFIWNIHTGKMMTIRRFVIVREGVHNSFCLSIRTFNKKGCSLLPPKEQSSYAVIYSSSTPPSLVPRETGISKAPIRVRADHPSIALPSTSRIDFSRVYKVKHDVWSKGLGLVHEDSIETLLDEFERSPSADVDARHEDINGNNVKELDPVIVSQAGLRKPGVQALVDLAVPA